MSHRRSPGIAVLGAVLIGALTALQARVNGSLGGELGDGVLAGGISFGSGLVVVLAIAAVLPAGRAGLSRLIAGVRERSIPAWMLFGGAAGAFTVACQGLAVATIGVALFNFGKFDEHTATQLGTVLTCGAFTIIPYSMTLVQLRVFYAREDAWTPTVIGIATSLLWCILAAVGLHFSVQHASTMALGIAAIAGAESLSKTIKCVLMGVWLRPHLGQIPWKQIGIFLSKVLFASLLCGWLAGFLSHILVPNGEIVSRMVKLKMLLGVSAAGMCAVLFFIILCYIMRVNEAQEMARFVRRRLGK